MRIQGVTFSLFLSFLHQGTYNTALSMFIQKQVPSSDSQILNCLLQRDSHGGKATTACASSEERDFHPLSQQKQTALQWAAFLLVQKKPLCKGEMPSLEAHNREELSSFSPTPQHTPTHLSLPPPIGDVLKW